MTIKEKFLEGLKAKIKLYQDAYDYNKGLPDDLFEALNGHPLNKLEPVQVGPAHLGESALEYGANINAVKEIITNAGTTGLPKSKIIELFPFKDGNVESIVTNSLSSLNKSEKIEGIKPRGIKMKGFYWRIKT